VADIKPTLIDRCPHCAGILKVRSLEQNSRLHAALKDISEQKEWAGTKWGIEDWKRLLVGAFDRANGRQTRVAPAIDGQGIEVLYRHTSKMSKQEMSELIEFITAWAIDQGVKLHDPEARLSLAQTLRERAGA
jgi:hypothetical protein